MSERASIPVPPSSSSRPLSDRDDEPVETENKVEEAVAPPIHDDRVPSIPPLPAAGPWKSYKEVVSQLAVRIVEAQKPIRVLQAVRWDNSIEEEFWKKRGKEMPTTDAAYYAGVDLGFDPKAKAEEFEQIARDCEAALANDDVGEIMRKTALEYRDVVRMLEARGTAQFYAYSRKLYGSPKDKFPDGKSTVRDLGHLLYGILTNVDQASL
ncbi:MAG: tyrosine/phenylalanine carboxypeptidase domain-containing protein, partial [Polyangiaceae bacterium]